jgi:hypothetical protein
MISIIIVVAIVAGVGWMAWGRWSDWRTPTGSLSSAEISAEALAFKAFTHGKTCLAAGQFADIMAAFERARAFRSETSPCGRSGPAAIRGARA